MKVTTVHIPVILVAMQLGCEYALAMSIAYNFLLIILCDVVLANENEEPIAAEIITMVMVYLLDGLKGCNKGCLN